MSLKHKENDTDINTELTKYTSTESKQASFSLKGPKFFTHTLEVKHLHAEINVNYTYTARTAQ